uniref:Endonuclease/exonuclease/phosphatase domain-containing protein n=1 Tax=viral metagenome TaxID=1070528 RepID=A0A6C0AF56_9ZZZZ
MIQCISKNVLANIYAIDRTDDRYDFLEDKTILEKNYRYSLLIKELLLKDLIFLQEIELFDIDKYKIDFPDHDIFSHIIEKKRTNIIGNLILWKKNLFELIYTDKNSTGIFIVLKYNDNFIIFGNVHYHTGTCEKSYLNRYNQMKGSLKLLKKLSEKYKTNKILLVGDFNDELLEGTITNTIIKETNFNISKIKETCHIYKNKIHKYMSLDKIISSEIKIKIQKIPENRPIPDILESSDHFSICFEIYE